MKNNTSYLWSISATILLLLWAGVSLGGNLIAAPAKFQADTVALEDLLRVGRAQFAWLGVTEIFLAIAFTGMCIIKRMWPSWISTAALLLLLLQQAGLHPLLQARTDLILAGKPAPSSYLHVVFIVTEIAKFVCLVWAAATFLRPQNQA